MTNETEKRDTFAHSKINRASTVLEECTKNTLIILIYFQISLHFHSLSAWPLIRDVFFYSVSLVVLVVFFDDQLIYWYEALILFLWYGAYVGFMKFNEPVEDSLRSLFKLPKIVSRLGKH